MIKELENAYIICRSDECFKKTSILFNKFGFKNLNYWKGCNLENESVMGCSIAHYSLIRYAKEVKLPYTVVFEDDAVPCNDAYEKTLDAINNRPKDCNYLVLGWVASEKPNVETYDRSSNFNVIAGSHAYALIGDEAYDSYLKAWENNGIADHIAKQIDTSYKYNERLFCQYTINTGIHLPKGWACEDFKITSNPTSSFSKAEQIIHNIENKCNTDESIEKYSNNMINIAYTIDVQGQGATQFMNQICASVFSIKKNKKPEEKIHVYIFYGNILEQLVISLNSISSEDFKISFRQISKEDLTFMQKFTKQQPNSQARAWCGIVYSRLWLPKLIPSEDKCLYLDSDTLVRGSLSELYDFDLKGKAYGMVMGCIPEYGYNSGVMLMDLKRLRELNLWDDLTEHMRLHAYTYMLPDQTVINRFFKDEITGLPLKYNYPPYTDRYRNATNDCNPAIIWHFYNGGTKPYAFVEADWCKVEWNQYLADADQTMKNNQLEMRKKSSK